MIETSMKELCVKRDQISEKRKGLQEQKQNLDIISNKIKIEEIKLKSLQSETFDMKIEQKELDDFLLQTLTKIKTLHKDVQKRINLLIQKNHEQANDNILVRQLKETMNMKQSIYLQAKDDLNSAEVFFKSYKFLLIHMCRLYLFRIYVYCLYFEIIFRKLYIT